MPARRFTNRRGRPRSERPALDKGTPELQNKRKQNITVETIDTCLSKGLISESQHLAALRFRRLYSLRFGAPHIRALDLGRASYSRSYSMAESTIWRERHEAAYRQLAQHLETAGSLVAVLRVAVFNDSSVLRPQLPTTQETLTRLKRGLDLINAHPKPCPTLEPSNET